jgi:hypothetical protein
MKSAPPRRPTPHEEKGGREASAAYAADARSASGQGAKDAPAQREPVPPGWSLLPGPGKGDAAASLSAPHVAGSAFIIGQSQFAADDRELFGWA